MGQDYTKKPIEDLLTAAKSGNLDAQNALGMLHELGLIPEANLRDALNWYSKAAKAGDPLAALTVGKIYQLGSKDIHVDQKAADAYFQMAEKGGFRKPEARLAEAGIVGKRTILLVDDSQTIRAVTRNLLSKSGFEVVEAVDAAQAIRFLQSGAHVDLILSDVEMPQMDGVEMLAIIRNRLKRKELPIVMVTSVRSLEVLKKAKMLGVQGWILKPFENDMLVQIVKKALAS